MAKASSNNITARALRMGKIRRFFEKSRPASSHADIITALCGTTTVIAAIIGVASFYHSVQISKLQDAEESIARLYPLDLSVNQSLGQNPQARLALHDDPTGKVFHALSPQDKSVLEEACDNLGDVFEYYLIVRDHIRDHPRGAEIIQSWNKYFEMTCRQSYGFRALINSERESWTPMFLSDFDKYTSGLPPSPLD
jgi:hypothetical protein